MNKKQKAVFLIGAAIVIIMGLFPSWYYHIIINKEQRIPFTIRGEYDYGFIFDPPPINEQWADDRYVEKYGQAIPTIDFGRLFVQWTTVTITIAALIFIMKDNKK